MNTVSTVKPTRAASPVPTPPPTTSPRPMSTIGTATPTGVMPAIEALVAPVAVAVVSTAHRAEGPMPMRHSLPSMLPADWPKSPTYTAPSAASCGVAAVSAVTTATSATPRSTSTAAMSARPWRRSPTMRPKASTSAKGMSGMAAHWRKFVSGVGFSNADAEFAPLKPPPLVPSCLMATCDAWGPSGTTASVTSRTAAGSSAATTLPWASIATGSSSCTVSYPSKVWGVPCHSPTRDSASARGSST